MKSESNMRMRPQFSIRHIKDKGSPFCLYLPCTNLQFRFVFFFYSNTADKRFGFLQRLRRRQICNSLLIWPCRILGHLSKLCETRNCIYHIYKIFRLFQASTITLLPQIYLSTRSFFFPRSAWIFWFGSRIVASKPELRFTPPLAAFEWFRAKIISW